jgi:hypothetical protein
MSQRLVIAGPLRTQTAVQSWIDDPLTRLLIKLPGCDVLADR